MNKPELKVVEQTEPEQLPIMIAAIPVPLLPMVWEQCLPLLQKVVDRANGELSLSGLYRRLSMGDDLLITVARGDKVVACNILEVRVLDNGEKFLYIPCVAGAEMEEWADRFLNIAKAIAIDLGCTQMRGMAARKGWLRKLHSMGHDWFHVHEVVGFKLEQEK